MSEPTTTPPSVGTLLESAWRDDLRAGRQSGAQTRTHLWASGRRECVRRMALDLMHPEDQEEFSDDSLERFERGKEREAAVNMRLLRIGPRAADPFEVVEGQRRFEVHDRDGVLLITGKIDGRLSFKRRRTRPVYEVKSGQAVARVETLEDLDRGKWTRHYLDQLLVYLFSENEPDGVLILDQPGMPLFLDVHLEDHLERAEAFLREARMAIDARTGKGPVPPFTEKLSLCETCPHLGKTCAPPVDYGAGLQVCSDPDLIQAAEIRKANAEAAKLFLAADKELKEAMRGKPQILVGPYILRGKPGKLTSYNVPAEIKEKYKKVDPEGKWTIEFDAHGVTD